jgi:hypothetical protein
MRVDPCTNQAVTAARMPDKQAERFKVAVIHLVHAGKNSGSQPQGSELKSVSHAIEL